MAAHKSFVINEEYIELNRLLKACRIAMSGGHAGQLVDSGSVFVDGVAENRKRAKIRPGQIVSCEGKTIKVIAGEVLPE